MSARHRADKGKPPRAAAAAPAEPGRRRPAERASKQPGRLRRRLAWFAAAVITVGVVLGGVIYAGCRSGANACVGKRIEAGTTGAEIFQRNCASCHGQQGEGRNGPAFTAGGPLSGLTFDERVEKTGRGKPLNAMPRWRGKLSPEQIRMVAAYTQTLSGLAPEPSVAGVR